MSFQSLVWVSLALLQMRMSAFSFEQAISLIWKAQEVIAMSFLQKPHPAILLEGEIFLYIPQEKKENFWGWLWRALIYHFHFVFGILYRPIHKQLLLYPISIFDQLHMFYESHTELHVQQDACMTENMKHQKD